MSASPLRNAAIAGIGESRLGRVPGVTALELQREAAEAALADAGLTFADIDGLLTTPVRTESWAMPCGCLLYTSPSPRDGLLSRMPSSA